MAAVKPEVWMFVDERREYRGGICSFIVGCLVCSKERWIALHGEVKRIGALRRKRRLDGIRQLLDKLQGLALLAYADLPTALVSSGEIDGTDDIQKMARQDNVWSQTVLATAAAVLACLRTSGVDAAEINLYYDPKDLTSAHRNAWETTLRKTLPEIAKEHPVTGAISVTSSLAFRRIEPVRKKHHGAEANCVQHGTFLAHQLCSQAPNLVSGEKVPRIIVLDHTDVLLSMVSKFTGGSTGADSVGAN